MDTAGQLGRFLLCVLLGGLGGALYDVLSLFAPKSPKKAGKILRFWAYVAFFALFAVGCVWAFSRFRFPAFREYFYLGFAVGMIIYLKSLHKAVAFFKNLCYNVGKKWINRLKNRKSFRKKEEKSL